MRQLTHIDLFAGIGSCSLASHWAGFETVQYVEIDPFCQKVLRKNFGKDIPIHDDIKTYTKDHIDKVYPRIRLGAENGFYHGGVNAVDAAQNKLEKAVKYNRIERPDICEKCGKPDKRFKDGRTSIQAHHYDYDKPLEVIWLCQKCHHNLHKELFLRTKEVNNMEAAPTIDLVTGGFP